MMNKKKNTAEKGHKKSQASPIFNVIIGIVFIVFAFIIFAVINGRISSLEEQTVKDSQQKGMIETYLGVLNKLNATLYEDFVSLTPVLSLNEDYFTSSYEFGNFQSRALTVSRKDSSNVFCYVEGTTDLKNSLILYYWYSVKEFNLCSLINPAASRGNDFWGALK